MPAFNSRLKPKKIGHVPLYSAMGAVGMLITGVTAMILPFPIKAVVILLFTGCLFLTVFCYIVGDELPFLAVKWASRGERNRITSETWTEC